MKKQMFTGCLVMAFMLILFGSCRKQNESEDVLDIQKKSCHCNAEEAMPGVKGEIITFGKGSNSIQIEKKGNVYILGGDIILTLDQVNYLKNKYEKSSKLPSTESAVIFNKLWPNGVVYYTVDSSLPDQYRVNNAISHWTANTMITFVPRSNQSNYVTFRFGDGCGSQIGMVGGQQFVDLANGCSTGNAIHEIGHLVGLFHEQTRMDRDDFVTVYENNVISGKIHNFYRYNVYYWGYDVGDFDFNSIMLYSSYDFSSNNQPTITKKDNSTFLAQRSYLSSGDIEGVNFLYLQNPNGLPCARIEVQNLLPYSDYRFQSSGDFYLAFYSNYNFNVPVIPSASITFNYSSLASFSSNYSGGDWTPRVDLTITNSGGLSRIYLGRFPYTGSLDLEDPQYGNYVETYTNNFYVRKGTGYNAQLDPISAYLSY